MVIFHNHDLSHEKQCFFSENLCQILICHWIGIFRFIIKHHFIPHNNSIVVAGKCSSHCNNHRKFYFGENSLYFASFEMNFPSSLLSYQNGFFCKEPKDFSQLNQLLPLFCNHFWYKRLFQLSTYWLQRPTANNIPEYFSIFFRASKTIHQVN